MIQYYNAMFNNYYYCYLYKLLFLEINNGNRVIILFAENCNYYFILSKDNYCNYDHNIHIIISLI